MQRILIIIFVLLNYNSFGQLEKLQGNWILDKIEYSNGNRLEINNPLFSTFIEYQFHEDSLRINDIVLNAVIDTQKISTRFRTLNYRFLNDYLVVSEAGDNKVYFFLTPDKFLHIHPEFEPKETLFEGYKVFVANPVVKPEFINSKDFEEYLRGNILNHRATSSNNNFFEAKFVLTKENKITKIKILQGITKDFEYQFVRALLSAEKYLKNNSGKDLLITQKFFFLVRFKHLANKEERELQAIYDRGRIPFEKNDFQSAIKSYEKINSLNITPGLQNKLTYTVDQIYINLGISYLATNQKEKACELFKKVGDKTNFKVRNFLIAFCE